MVRTVLALCAPFVLFWPQVSIAQDQDKPAGADDTLGKWNFNLSAAATNAAIRIVESEIELPDDLAAGDFEASLSDDLTVSSTIVSGSVGYRVLPFVEVFARGGLISSDTETGVTIMGTPNGPFSDFFNGPITVDRETSREVDGYSLGLGGNGVLPITKVGGDTLAAYGGFQYIWNRFDETVSSEGATTSFGLLYPVSLDRQNVIWRVGGSYNWISRDVEQTLTLNGEPVRVRVTQEFEDPWAVEAGVGIPLGKDTLLGLGVWHQLSGETSALASITYRFGTRN
ncbi:MAG: hypothetical protein AAF253_09955 [Pseudomonadota bacterium]